MRKVIIHAYIARRRKKIVKKGRKKTKCKKCGAENSIQNVKTVNRQHESLTEEAFAKFIFALETYITQY